MRRNRHHAKGDHRYCSLPKCDAAFEGVATPLIPPPAKCPPPPPPLGVPTSRQNGKSARGMSVDLGVLDEVPRVPGGIEQAVTAFIEALPYREPDPRALLAQIAVRLAQRVDETGAMPAAVRELRVMLMQLTEVPDQPSGPLDVHRLRRAQHRLDALLASQGM